MAHYPYDFFYLLILRLFGENYLLFGDDIWIKVGIDIRSNRSIYINQVALRR